MRQHVRQRPAAPGQRPAAPEQQRPGDQLGARGAGPCGPGPPPEPRDAASWPVANRGWSAAAGTVRNHLLAAIQKLGARNRADAAQIAREKAWL